MYINLKMDPEFDALYDLYMQTEQGQRLLMLEGIHPDQLDVGAMSHKYFINEVQNMSVDANANANEEISPNNYQSEIVKGLQKLEGYFLIWRYSRKRFGLKYANKLIDAIWSGDLYFHDASGVGVQVPYCFAYSTTNIMIEGRPYGQLPSLPPKRSDSFVAQVIETTMDLSQEFMGAIAPSDFIVNLCWYLKNERYGRADAEGIWTFSKIEKEYVINQFQKFIHVMNNKFRISGQSPFTNLSVFDRVDLERLFGELLYLDGSKIDIEYVIAIQDIFMDFFSNGQPNTNLPYRFPVVTVNMAIDENRNALDQDFLNSVAKYNRRLGCFNIYANEGSKIAMCCRFVNDTERMNYRTDSFGNGGMNIGSHRVVTLNLPRISIKAQEVVEQGLYDNCEDAFFNLLNNELLMCRDLLQVHREEILQRRVDRGFLKFFKPLKWFSLDMLFSTIGLVGIYEMCSYMGYDINEEDGEEFVAKVLKYIDDTALRFSKETGHSFNTEEIPAEGTAVKLAKKDNIYCGTNIKLYSNQYIPLSVDVPYMKRIKLTGKFMNLVSGGGILHLNVKEQIDSDDKMKKLINIALKNGVAHFAINYGFGECENGHTVICGNELNCPICNGKIKYHMTRVIGYFTKVSSWNAERKEEFKFRKFKNID